MSRMISVWEKGITKKVRSTGKKITMGAARYTGRSTSLGVMSSFPMSLTASATVWMAPCQPTSMGPGRSCMWAETLRSIQMRKRAFTATRAMTPMTPAIIPKILTPAGCVSGSI